MDDIQLYDEDKRRTYLLGLLAGHCGACGSSDHCARTGVQARTPKRADKQQTKQHEQEDEEMQSESDAFAKNEVTALACLMI